MRGTVFAAVLASGLLMGGLGSRLPHGLATQATAWAEETWRAEFDDVCGKTSDAMAFPVDELKRLVERCDKLKPQIEALEATPRKVFLKRLQMCRDLYAYVLEAKKTEPVKQ